MLIKSVGPDIIGDIERLGNERFTNWIIYYYESGSYDGTGTAVISRHDGAYEVHSLSHCSCYGPLDNGTPEIYTHDQLLRWLGVDECGMPRRKNDCDFNRMQALTDEILDMLKIAKTNINIPTRYEININIRMDNPVFDDAPKNIVPKILERLAKEIDALGIENVSGNVYWDGDECGVMTLKKI